MSESGTIREARITSIEVEHALDCAAVGRHRALKNLAAALARKEAECDALVGEAAAKDEQIANWEHDYNGLRSMFDRYIAIPKVAASRVLVPNRRAPGLLVVKSVESSEDDLAVAA